MNKLIDIKKALQEKGISKEEAGALLFPKLMYPERAFSRILRHGGDFSVSQLSKIAELLGVEVSELFEGGSKSSPDNSNSLVICGFNFELSISLSDWRASLKYEGETIEENMLLEDEGLMTLDEVLAKVKTKIEGWTELS